MKYHPPAIQDPYSSVLPERGTRKARGLLHYYFPPIYHYQNQNFHFRQAKYVLERVSTNIKDRNEESNKSSKKNVVF
jgi:hypothetical protein